MRPRKSLGQNFLRDDAIIGRIIDALYLQPEETVVEIGPGTGALTYRLVESAGNVIAIEFDRDLIPQLNKQFGSRENFTLVHDDALTVDLSEIVTGTDTAKLVANLPYNISTPILQRLIDCRYLFSKIVLMFQREVVERITASPGGKERGFLSVLVESAFETEYLFDVPPTAFYPVPKVWSAVVRLTPKESNVVDEKPFRKLVSAAFVQKRKTIHNNLRNVYENAADLLNEAGIDGKRRAETLTLDEWVTLTNNIAKK
jgi:16S rRNA (adenine1518-N6/adenine1519-N6)-dimethyltransferase